jgi:hypothetical protein
MYLDPAIRDWVLLPIMVVMVLVGILRHYITLLLNSPQKPNVKAIRETGALNRSARLRGNGNFITEQGFAARREYLSDSFSKGTYLKAPTSNQAANPMDPAGMELMMDMMKKNMAMIVPQTLIMNWVIYFFSGFVSCMYLPWIGLIKLCGCPLS